MRVRALIMWRALITVVVCCGVNVGGEVEKYVYLSSK